MKITGIEPFLLHVPLAGEGIADSTHQVSHFGVPGVILRTDAGLRGYGYTGTLAHLATDRLIRDCIGQAFGPMLMGRDPLGARGLWNELASSPAVRWVGRAGVTQMALAAIDIALWDIKAKAAELPLWKLLGGTPGALLAYNTDGGWLNWSKKQLIEGAKKTLDDGFRGVKLKIGSPDPHDDLDRIQAVRDCIGPRVNLMVDANGAWDLPTAIKFGGRLADYNVHWLEEPLPPDDVTAHVRLAQAIETPIALGESLYSVTAFRDFIVAGGVHFVQPDAIRLGGVTPCWQTLELAGAFGLPVVPHAADMMQIHQHLALAHSACSWMEYIPWLRACFQEPATVEDGCFRLPQAPGAGSTLTAAALERFAVE